MKLLLAVDLSESSHKVIKSALQLFEKQNFEIYLLHVADPEPELLGLDYGPASSRVHMKNKIQKERKKLFEFAEKYKSEAVKITPLSAQGPTAEKIIEETDKLNCDVIIIGSHGRGAVRHILVGSVSEEILRKSGMPVLIIPTRSSD